MEAHLLLDDDFHSPTPCSSPDMTSGDDLSDSSNNLPASIVNASNYITVKEGCQSAFTTDELTIAINQCKKLVLESEECSEERKWFVRRLIELRHRLQQAKESEESKTLQAPEESFVKLGHHFKIEYLPTSTAKKYCDRCCGTIWNVVQSYYQCTVFTFWWRLSSQLSSSMTPEPSPGLKPSATTSTLEDDAITSKFPTDSAEEIASSPSKVMILIKFVINYTSPAGGNMEGSSYGCGNCLFDCNQLGKIYTVGGADKSVMLCVFESIFSDCQYRCHIKCVESLYRVCAHLVMSEKPNYIDKICPEVGLDTQGYRCYECDSRINYNISKGYYPLFSGSFLLGNQSAETNIAEARLCNYNGHHYCPSCHWNTFSIIPARVMLNWDFEPQKVCRASYQLIRITKSRPIITLDERLNRFVEELAIIKKKREELGLMKQYIATCRPSIESGLVMRELEWRRHLIHSTTMFSLDDLCDIYNGTFLSKLEAVYDFLRTHIKVDCTVCKGRGYICELCDDSEVIFGFDSNTYTCPKCDTVSHKICWIKQKICKKCLRLEQKLEQE